MSMESRENDLEAHEAHEAQIDRLIEEDEDLLDALHD